MVSNIWHLDWRLTEMEYKSDAGYVGRLKKGSRLVVENPQGEKIIEVRDI